MCKTSIEDFSSYSGLCSWLSLICAMVSGYLPTALVEIGCSVISVLLF